MKKIFVARVIPHVGLDKLREVADVTVWPGELPPTRAELLQAVQDRKSVV